MYEKKSLLPQQERKAVNISTMATADVLNARYKFYTTLIKSYINHSQMVENKTKAEVQERIRPIINNLVESHHFGSKFCDEIQSHINSRFQQVSSEIYDTMLKDSSLPEEVFNGMVKELKASSIVKGFSPRFTSVMK